MSIVAGGGSDNGEQGVNKERCPRQRRASDEAKERTGVQREPGTGLSMYVRLAVGQGEMTRMRQRQERQRMEAQVDVWLVG